MMENKYYFWDVLNDQIVTIDIPRRNGLVELCSLVCPELKNGLVVEAEKEFNKEIKKNNRGTKRWRLKMI